MLFNKYINLFFIINLLSDVYCEDSNRVCDKDLCKKYLLFGCLTINREIVVLIKKFFIHLYLYILHNKQNSHDYNIGNINFIKCVKLIFYEFLTCNSQFN